MNTRPNRGNMLALRQSGLQPNKNCDKVLRRELEPGVSVNDGKLIIPFTLKMHHTEQKKLKRYS